MWTKHTFARTCRTGIAMLTLWALVMVGCGQLTDTDRIRVARIGDRYITRGDLFKLIRDMPDQERPMIRNRSDLRRILNQHIDSRIKLPLGRQLANEGKIEISRDEAREEFFRRSGDEADMLRQSWYMEVPPPGVVTPLMEVYGLTPELLQLNKDVVDEGTDRVKAELLGEKAVEFRAMQALQEGRISLDAEEIEREYQFMKDQLVAYEEISFIGIRFPTHLDNAAARASQVREQVDGGESFADIVAHYREKDAEEQVGYVIQSDIVNDPASERLRGFWSAASGAQSGDVVGPVYLPAYQQVVEDREGRTRIMQMPDAYLIFEVLEHNPERTLTLDEARPLVAAPLLKAKMMHILREEHDVEVFEEDLPEPSHVAGPLAI